MPVAPRVTYPGVYIQEVESNVKTIVPVETSTTAFVGRAPRGPVDRHVVVNSFADYERIFGGLWRESKLGFAVRDFFLNGGSKAVIARVFLGAVQTTTIPAQPANPDADPPTEAVPERTVSERSGGRAEITLAPGVVLQAKTPGTWGNELRARVTTLDSNDAAEAAIMTEWLKKHGPEGEFEASELFSLAVRDAKTGVTEIFENVTLNPNSVRRLDRVIENSSELVEIADDLPPGTAPFATPTVTPAPAGTGQGIWDSAADAPPNVEAAWTNAHFMSVPENARGSDGVGLATAMQSDESPVLPGNAGNKTGIYLLEDADIFNLLVVPRLSNGTTFVSPPQNVLEAAAKYCEDKRAILLVEPPDEWRNKEAVKTNRNFMRNSTNAAVYYPLIRQANPLRGGHVEENGPCGAIAGVIARTDATRGLWKAPAGLEATLSGVKELAYNLTDAENGELNPLGVNCLRTKVPAGHIVWGARTMVGDDRLASQWKYLPVRRMALFIEETLYRNTQWAVFEPNDEPLWSQLRLNIGVFMHGLFRQGAFQGGSPGDAYFVNCDSSTTTQADIDRGIVNIMVGFAPLKPAEFIVIYIQQIAGNLAA